VRVLAWLLGGAALAGLQTGLASLTSVGGSSPDLLLVTVILAAVYGRGDGVLLVAPFLGYLKDLYAGGVVGDSFLAFFLLAWVITVERHRLDFDSYLFDAVVVGGTLADGLLSLAFQDMTMAGVVNWIPALPSLVGRALYNLILAEFLRWARSAVLPLLVRHPARRRFRAA
jgi:cell shape-determining protein MreD